MVGTATWGPFFIRSLKMDILQTFHVNRNIEHGVLDGVPVLRSNGTTITIPALIELCNNEQNRQGDSVMLSLDGLFLSAAKELPNQERLVDVSKANQKDYSLAKAVLSDNAFEYEYICPFFALIEITERSGRHWTIKGKFQ